jgi:DNA-binding response OmpR family regulator
MIEDRHSVLTGFEPLQTGGAEARWMGRDSSADHVVVRGKRILLVDDEKPLRACVRMVLELEGIQVTEAGDGAEALQLFAPGKFDLVITDFQMPLMAGNELAVNLKRLAPSVPILMVTASGRARREAENPVDALLGKPFDVTELRGTLRKLLSARQEAAEASFVSTGESRYGNFASEGQFGTRLQA